MRCTGRISLAALLGGLMFTAPLLAQERPSRPVQPRLPTPVAVPAQPHGWLGFAYMVHTTRTEKGAETILKEEITVGDVSKGSPADKAGLEPQDTLVTVNGEAATQSHISALVRRLHPGDTVHLQVRRAGKLHDLTLQAAERPAYLSENRFGGPIIFSVPGDSIRRTMRIFLDSARFGMDSMHFPHMIIRSDSMMIMRFGNNGRADTIRMPRMDSLRGRIWALGRNMDSLRVRLRDMPRDFRGTFELGAPQPFELEVVGRRAIAGAELQELNSQLAGYFGVREGLLVERVTAGTPAAKAGLQAGDIVTAADGHAVGDVADLRRALRGREGTVKLEVSRKGTARTLELKWP